MSDVRDDAPAHVAKSSAEREKSDGSGSVVGHTETVNRPRADVYAFWRDFTNLSQVMENVAAVRVEGDRRSHWTVRAPGGEVEWDAEITEDEPGRLIAWRSLEGAEVRHSGRVEFLDAPPGRGTWVRAVIAYDPPGGIVGKIAAKLFQKEPSIQTRRDLRRLKQFLETGEIATSSPPNPQPHS
ncbi:MAG: SRPBCC family protein [Sphingomonas sp.]